MRGGRSCLIPGTAHPRSRATGWGPELAQLHLGWKPIGVSPSPISEAVLGGALPWLFEPLQTRVAMTTTSSCTLYRTLLPLFSLLWAKSALPCSPKSQYVEETESRPQEHCLLFPLHPAPPRALLGACRFRAVRTRDL